MELIEIERSIIKKYRSKIYRKLVRAVKDFSLIKENDVICCCISGGKDSFLLAKCLQELQIHSKYHFELKFLVMDPGYKKENLDKIKENLKLLNIDALIYKTNIFEEIKNSSSPCYLCARKRRGNLYYKAKEMGCNKIALGHHFNDVIETTLLNLFYSGTYKTMVPKLRSTNHPGMELIRPMVYVEEKEIRNYIDYCEIKAMNCGCPVASGELPSKRKEIKKLIADLKKDFKDVDKCIYGSSENVNLNCVMGWTHKGKKYSFLDFYDEEE